jgi:membrane protein DedA with SNARE-associated domain
VEPMDLWSYTILFVGVATSWMGIPIVGGGVLAGAGVLAGDGKLDVWLVVLVAAAGASTGGYVGYLIGARARDALTSRPGRWQRHRRRALSAGEHFYRRWGPLAVFVTPTWVSGALRMPRNSFLIWNATAALVSSLAAVFGAYAVASAVLGHISTRGGLIVSAAAMTAMAAAAAGAGAAIVWHRRRARCEPEATGEGRAGDGAGESAPESPAHSADARPNVQPGPDTRGGTRAQSDCVCAWPHDDDRHVPKLPEHFLDAAVAAQRLSGSVIRYGKVAHPVTRVRGLPRGPQLTRVVTAEDVGVAKGGWAVGEWRWFAQRACREL